MGRKPIIIANWKMNLGLTEVKRFFSHFTLEESRLKNCTLVICPSFALLEQTLALIGGRPIVLGAQNLFWEERGAYTGEVSGQQLIDVGCQYVIVGHSERRALFHEDDEIVSRKIKVALQYGLTPVVCLGENYQEKEAGQTKKVIEAKMQTCLGDLRSFELKKLIIAYEPMWAISTSPENPEGLADSPESAQVVHKLMRRVVAEMSDEHVAKAVPVIYGGSVNPDNIKGFASMDDIDGVLVGGASREADTFQEIIKTYLS